MLNRGGEQIYVAELTVPTCFYPSKEKRYRLEDPVGFRVSKGYYAIRPPDEQSTLDGYAELVPVFEFVSHEIKEAEEHALKVGRMFGSVASEVDGGVNLLTDFAQALGYAAGPLHFPDWVKRVSSFPRKREPT